MLCYRCGSHVQDDAKECWNCGTALDVEPERPKHPSRRSGGPPDRLLDRSANRSSVGRTLGVVFRVGEMIDDRYRVSDIIGSGGTGVVYRAHDTQSAADVAVKVVNKRLVETHDEQRLFSRQIKIAKKLVHPYVIRVFDEGLDEGRPFFAMELLEGLSLRRIIDLRSDKNLTFTVEEVEPILEQLGQALDYAHATTFHGNLKPDNIIVLPDVLKVTDFGLLRGLPRRPFLAIQESRGHNARYMAPEVRQEVPHLDRTVDVYSMGVILTEMLLGMVYDASRADELTHRGSKLDPALLAVIRRSVAPEPADRYSSAGAVHLRVKTIMERSSARPASHFGSFGPPPRTPEANTERLGLDATPERRAAPTSPPAPPTSRSTADTSSVAIDQAMIQASEAFLGRDLSGEPAPDDADLDLSIEIEAQEPVFEGGPEDVTSRAYETRDRPSSFQGPDYPGPLPPERLEEISSSAIELVADAQLPPNARRTPRAKTNGRASVPPPPIPPIPPIELEQDARPLVPRSAPSPGARHAGGLSEGTRRIPAKRPMTRPRMPAVRVGSAIGSPTTTLIPDPAAHARAPTMFPLQVPPAPPNSKRLYGALGAAVLAVLLALGIVAKLIYDQQAASSRKMEALQAQLTEIQALAHQARENEARLAEAAEKERERAESARKAETQARRRAEAEAARKVAARREAARRAREAASASRAAQSASAVEDRRDAERRALEARRLAARTQRAADEAAAREQEERSRALAQAERRQVAEQREAEAERKRQAEERAARIAEEKAQEIASRAGLRSDEGNVRPVADEPTGPKRAPRGAEASGAGARRPITPGATSKPSGNGTGSSTAQADRDTSGPNLSGRAAAVPAQCPKGMVFLQAGRFTLGTARNDPERNFGDIDAQPVELDAFCVDYYEYPNRRGNMPRTGVTLAAARSLCKRRDKRLCTEGEWERVCKGRRGVRYPYGNQWNPETCNTSGPEGSGRSVGPSGSFKACRSGFNVYDLSGNVSEWTDTTWDSAFVVKGGSADRPGYDGRCSARLKKKGSAKSNTLGFRCCADPIAR